MADLQSYFNQFHDKIKISNFEENATLKDKRDLLLDTLTNRIDDDAPSFESFNQGSYSMFTGIKPKANDYDIDVGIIFDCYSEVYEDPVELKKYVRDALTHANRTVLIRRPCVTVQYLKDGVVDYHVDLAIYAKRPYDSIYDLAKGKEFSESEQKYWEISDPKGLKDLINNRFSDESDRAQMRRCIKYLKKWRDQKIISGKPFSIAFTVASYNWFTPSKDVFSGVYSDLDALRLLIENIQNQFDFNDWLTVSLPVQPYSDLNEKMTETQMSTFKERLSDLKSALISAQDEDVVEDACKLLKKQFGEDFPVPEKSATAKKAAVAGFAPAGGTA